LSDLHFTIDDKPTFIDAVWRWGPRISLALLFVAVGTSKFSSHGGWVRLFDQIGFGQWFRVFTGVMQTSGAVLLLVPRLAWIGAGILSLTMLGAVLVQLLVLHSVLFVIPAILMMISAFVGAQARNWI
jgi:putative oxidoreductase